MASGDFIPSTRLRITSMSVVTSVPTKVLLFRRNAPMTSALPFRDSQPSSCMELSSVPLVVMKMPMPPSRSLRTFFAMQKSWMLEKVRDRSTSPELSCTRRFVTKGTLVMARSTELFAMVTASKPDVRTVASGYSCSSICAVMGSISTASIWLDSLMAFGILARMLPMPAEPSRMEPPRKPRLPAMRQRASTTGAGV